MSVWTPIEIALPPDGIRVEVLCSPRFNVWEYRKLAQPVEGDCTYVATGVFNRSTGWYIENPLTKLPYCAPNNEMKDNHDGVKSWRASPALNQYSRE